MIAAGNLVHTEATRADGKADRATKAEERAAKLAKHSAEVIDKNERQGAAAAESFT